MKRRKTQTQFQTKYIFLCILCCIILLQLFLLPFWWSKEEVVISYNKLVNKNNFEYHKDKEFYEYYYTQNDFPLQQMIANESNKKENINIFIGIISSLQKTASNKRETIRNTYLRFYDTQNKKLEEKMRVEYRFFVGECSEEVTDEDKKKECKTEYAKAIAENSHYNDIVFIDSDDGYEFLTFKTIYLLRWSYERYFYEYLIKIDDDVFLRLDILMVDIQSKREIEEIKSFMGSNEYRGFVWRNAEKKYDKRDKNYDTKYEQQFYPPFCSGNCYLLTYDLVEYLSLQSHKLKIYPNEDTSIGIWLSPLKVNIVHDVRFQVRDGICFDEMIARHPSTSSQMEIMYNNVVNEENMCLEIPDIVCPIGFYCYPKQVTWSADFICSQNGFYFLLLFLFYYLYLFYLKKIIN